MTDINDLINNMRSIQSELKQLDQAHIYVGVNPDDDHLTMIALVQEYGKHIEAKHYPYLVIPTSNAKGRKAGEIPGLYKRGLTLGYNDVNGYVVCFVLRKSVDIPSRPFLRFTFNHQLQQWLTMMQQYANKVANGNMAAKTALQLVGKQMQSDIQNTIIRMKQPNNAPLTVERKGKDDPLVDTGHLTNSIQVIIDYGDELNE